MKDITKTSGAHLLMSENIRADLALLPLHELDVRLHALLGVRARKEVGDVRI